MYTYPCHRFSEVQSRIPDSRIHVCTRSHILAARVSFISHKTSYIATFVLLTPPCYFPLCSNVEHCRSSRHNQDHIHILAARVSLISQKTSYIATFVLLTSPCYFPLCSNVEHCRSSRHNQDQALLVPDDMVFLEERLSQYTRSTDLVL